MTQTDAQIRDAAVAELKQTTVGYINSKWTTPPAGTHWKAGLDLLAQIGATPPPPTGFAQLPVGPFTKSSPVAYRQAASPALIKGLDIENFPGNVDGILIMQWPPTDGGRFTLQDCITQNIGNVPPTSNGTAEAGVWIGQPTDANRIVCDGSWEGLWTGAECHDSVIQNFTIGKSDGKGGYTLPSNHVGLYNEHFTRRTLFQNFDIYAKDIGNVSEWWYADSTYAAMVAKEYPTAAAGKAGSCHNTYTNGRIYCPAGGHAVFWDAGTWGNQGSHVTFWGPGDAWFLPTNLAGPDKNVVDLASCTFLNAGKQIAYHNNPIGLAAKDGDQATMAERYASAKRLTAG